MAEGTPADDRALFMAKEVVPIAVKETIFVTMSHFLGKIHVHSVLGQNSIKGTYLDQRLSQHKGLYPLGL